MASNKDKTQAADGQKDSGVSGQPDPTIAGAYPPAGDQYGIFGGPLPTGTGAPGTAGSAGSRSDATNEPGQTVDGLTGISEAQITQSGAPGSQGASGEYGAGSPITYTAPSDGINPYRMVTVSDELSGPGDSTQANDSGYATGGPQLPGIAGNEPQAGSSRYQSGGGRVLRGGRAVKP